MEDEKSTIPFIMGDSKPETEQPHPQDAPTNDYLIVSRFDGLTAWLYQHGISGTVVPVLNDANAFLLRDRHLVSTRVALHWAAQAKAVTEVRIANLTPHQRRVGLTLAEMLERQSDITMTTYVVHRIKVVSPINS